MTFSTTIRTAVGQSLLTKIGRFFNGSVLDVLNESIQNCRRAGATRIDIDRIDTDRGPVLRIRDDGRGISDPAKFLTLGDSGWGEEIARSEDPAGMGVFSLAGRYVTVRSYAAMVGVAWQATIPPHAWESGASIDVVPCSLDKGTEIEIDLPESWAAALAQAVKDAARFCPVPIWFGGDRVSQESFLREAARVEDWNGCRIGIFSDKHSVPRELVRINFHGVTVPCRLPHIVDVDGGRGWYAKVDIIEARQLQLVLPARKEMVQNAALDALREACTAAIFRTIAREGHHRLSHAHWLQAKSMGVPLPEAAPWLAAWTPSTAETDRAMPGERIAGEPMILMPSDEAYIDQCIARTILAGQPLGAVPVDRVDEFAGYGWYDALPCVVGTSFRIERKQEDIFDYVVDAQVPPDIVSGRVHAITLELAVRASSDPEMPADILALPVDVLIVATGCWNDLDDIAILLSPDCAITPADLASLLENACFYPSDDCDADSYHTQQAAFEMQARFTANMLLLGEDAAIIERVREAVREHVSWLVPKDRPITVRAINYLVEAAFANDDETAVIAAAG
ncbi:ATP-binding protein [Sphingopyxis sp. GC21]|uniref:ATP-binding protein n=1 Tax=Sphingopyxis sp. GC21 TaxID=2933562 RepID=UPI0021E38B1A|nr:ATP-binding protein [Sphingopyxis sp. GC21]